MDYWHMYYICPFFHWDDVQRIGCEGKTVLQFPDRTSAQDFMKNYCASHHWKDCSYARMLLDYYGRQLF